MHCNLGDKARFCLKKKKAKVCNISRRWHARTDGQRDGNSKKEPKRSASDRKHYNIKAMKRQATCWEKIFAKDIPHKVLLIKIYKEVLKFNSKNTNNLMEN